MNTQQLNDLTLKIFKKIVEEDTINPPGNEMRGALLFKEIMNNYMKDDDSVIMEVQDIGNNRANFILEFGNGEGPLLEFSGHLDTVPVVGDWHYDPIGITEENGRFYGRGSADMKSGLSALSAAALALYEKKDQMKGKLRLTFVADEEIDNLGMHAFLASHASADYTILAEPTSLHVDTAHRGVSRFHIDLHGKAFHAALRPDELTAVQKASRALAAIDDMTASFLPGTHPVLPPPSICITKIQGYEKDNVVPGTVRLLTDYRTAPPVTEEEAICHIRKALSKYGLTEKDYDISTHYYMHGGETPENDPFVLTCLEEASKVTGREEKASAFGAFCELTFLVAHGSKCVVIGPGSLDQAHTIDEYVEKQQLFDAAKLYLSIAEKILM